MRVVIFWTKCHLSLGHEKKTLLKRVALQTLGSLKARANARNIVGQQDATLLGPTCCERLHTKLCVVPWCCDLLEVVG